MADWRVIRAAGLVAAPWRNGLGTSRDIATGRGPDGAMRWQVGIADLERDAPFSHYPDYDRIFTPIAGDPPPELAFHGGPWEPCPLLTPKPFPGDVPTLSRIPAPGRAFNAIVDRRHHVAEVSVLRMEPGGTIRTPEAAIVVVHCLSGALDAGTALAAGDSLVGGGGPLALQATLESIILAVVIEPLS